MKDTVTPSPAVGVDVEYVVSYIYDNPGRAGPFKGRLKTTLKYSKGDSIRGPFGRATVTSARRSAALAALAAIRSGGGLV